MGSVAEYSTPGPAVLPTSFPLAARQNPSEKGYAIKCHKGKRDLQTAWILASGIPILTVPAMLTGAAQAGGQRHGDGWGRATGLALRSLLFSYRQ